MLIVIRLLHIALLGIAGLCMNATELLADTRLLNSTLLYTGFMGYGTIYFWAGGYNSITDYSKIILYSRVKGYRRITGQWIQNYSLQTTGYRITFYKITGYTT